MSKKLEKLLIANRGEIAVRIARACRELGIRSVAVYSDADRESLHVRLADEACPIGPPPAAESYLRMEKILDAAKRTGAGAIHPGYGFLAENAEFARAVTEAGLVFVGPPASAVALMGDKARARALAERAGVPVVAGSAPLASEEKAISEAERIGYPLLVKAVAGGGGKGMRHVDGPEDLVSAFRQARSEAQSSFGDPSVYLEKLLEAPRHIEIQIVADSFGNAVHLNERECSIQRRHQKLLEEAPSPFVDEKLRGRMAEAALTLARESAYRNAGTVEFLVDGARNFYFLEVNARLQVEHPLTEILTGVDLVYLQLAIAAGERIPFRQEQVQRRGWTMEFRVTAEDPFENFLPSAGEITFIRAPEGPGIRNDSGIYNGFRVTAHYDPLIAKLIVAGESREHCLSRARRAIREYQIEGVATTLPFFERLLDEPRFVSGHFDVGFVDRHWMTDIASRESSRRNELYDAAVAAAAVALNEKPGSLDGRTSRTARSPWKQAAMREATRGRG